MYKRQTLIFFYLAHVVLPMFQGAELEARKVQQPAWLAEARAPLLLAVEEQNQVAMRLDDAGAVQFFQLKNGEALQRVQLPLPQGVTVASVGQDQPGSRRVAVSYTHLDVYKRQRPCHSCSNTNSPWRSST